MGTPPSKIFVHNKTFDAIIPEEINLNVGKEINVALSRKISTKTSQPYSECKDLTTFSSKLYRIFQALNKTYRQYDCFKLCLQKNINTLCGCYFSRYTKVNKEFKACLNLTQLACIYTQQDSFLADQDCLDQCPLECNSITYDFQTTTLEYPNKRMYKSLLNSSSFVQSFENFTGEQFSFESLKDVVISLKVYYPSNSYTFISESPKTSFFDLIAQIGGSLGLFLGFSIFHFIEIGEIIILMICDLFTKKSTVKP